MEKGGAEREEPIRGRGRVRSLCACAGRRRPPVRGAGNGGGAAAGSGASGPPQRLLEAPGSGVRGWERGGDGEGGDGDRPVAA